MMGALLLFSMGKYPDFRQRQGCGYDLLFFGKRENNFTFLQKRENDFIMSIKKTITQPKSCSIVGGATVYLPIQCDQNWKGE
jgi:hypothetical protein